MSRWFSLFIYLGCLFAFVRAAADAEPAAPSEGGGIKGTALRIAKAYINGGVIPVDFDQRAKKDAADGVTRIDDSNSQELLASPGEDVWVIVVHGRDSDFLATAFAEAHTNVTKQFAKEVAAAEGESKKELEHYKFARLDYYNDWATCTRMLINKPPYLVFVSENDGKKEYRFLGFPPFPADGEKMYTLIKDGHWKNIRPWASRYNPVDGDRAHLVEKYIAGWQTIGEYTKSLPVWSWIIVSMGAAALTQSVTAWLFGGGRAAAANPQHPAQRAAAGGRQQAAPAPAVRK